MDRDHAPAWQRGAGKVGGGHREGRGEEAEIRGVSGSELLGEEARAIRAKLESLLELSGAKTLRPAHRKALDLQLRALIDELESALGKIDPVAHPVAIFDPSNPKIIGRFTALALVGQARHSLSAVGPFYGSGVYAIYYRGDYPLYRPLSGSETPIYVGKAAPATEGARTARDQGERLAARLNEHRKNIAKATSTLDIADFDCRFLVVQSGWERSAEDYLISLFRPIWNNEVNILYGLGKHGDSAKTRANKRSPWDTLHPGRAWAAATLEDARTPDQIAGDLDAHFAAKPVFPGIPELLEAFFRELRQ
jgi:hypothetical protein